MKVSYIRVSTKDQKLDRQIDMMTTAQGVEKVFSDKASGKNTARAGLQELLSFVREGDTVVVESISRLARSTHDFLGIVAQLDAKGVTFVSLKESFDTSTPSGRFTMTMFAALAALQRETILQAQKEGIESAKARGKHLGRPRLQLPKDWEKVLFEWEKGELKAVEAMKSLGVSKTAFYKLVRREKAG